MRSPWTVLLCIATLTAAAVCSASPHRQTSSTTSSSASSSSAAKTKTTRTAKSHSSTSTTPATRRTSAHRRRSTRSAKFVPRQKAPTADRISEIQSALGRGGYYQGEPTGKWDPDTIAAMQKFQSANGIDPSGKIDAPSLQKLGLGSDIAGVAAPKPITPGSTPPSANPAGEPPRSIGQSPTASSAAASANSNVPSTAASISAPPPAIAAKSSQQ